MSRAATESDENRDIAGRPLPRDHTPWWRSEALWACLAGGFAAWAVCYTAYHLIGLALDPQYTTLTVVVAQLNLPAVQVGATLRLKVAASDPARAVIDEPWAR